MNNDEIEIEKEELEISTKNENSSITEEINIQKLTVNLQDKAINGKKTKNDDRHESRKKKARYRTPQERKTKKLMIALYIMIAIAAIATIFVYFKYLPPAKGKYDSFAQCIKSSGATFYGAFWCPHCQNEKKLFGDAVQFLPYVECSTPDGSAQLQVCKDASIQNYPTWIFADGSRLVGEVPLSQLADKTGCTLPTSAQ